MPPNNVAAKAPQSPVAPRPQSGHQVTYAKFNMFSIMQASLSASLAAASPPSSCKAPPLCLQEKRGHAWQFGQTSQPNAHSTSASLQVACLSAVRTHRRPQANNETYNKCSVLL